MSSTDNNLDNSTTALLQPSNTGSEAADHNDDELVALTKGEQPVVDQAAADTTTEQQSSQPDTNDQSQAAAVENNTKEVKLPEPDSKPEPDIQQTSSAPQAEIEIENETAPSVATSPNSNEAETANAKTEEDNSAPDANDKTEIIAPKSSTLTRLRKAIKSPSSSCAKKARMATSLEDISSLRLWKGIVAEFLGTMLLTLIGCGSCINLRGMTNVTSPVVQIALCFGLSVATIVWAIGHVSGGHINPAVTMAMLATRKISLAKAIFFIVFQLVGAVVGAGLLYGFTPREFHGNLGATLVNDNVTVGQAVGVEIFITFVLVFVVFASVDGKRKDLNGSTPLTIGLSVTMCHLFAIDFTGSSMNTARSFGPAVVVGNWSHHWVYWLGPIVGGVVAGLLYENIFAVNASLDKAKAFLLSSDYDDEKYQAQKRKIRILEEDTDEPDAENLPLSEKSEAKGVIDSNDPNV